MFGAAWKRRWCSVITRNSKRQYWWVKWGSSHEKTGRPGVHPAAVAIGTHFTCFTGTEVEILTLYWYWRKNKKYWRKPAAVAPVAKGESLTMFRYSVYSLYRYKSTNTDSEARHSQARRAQYTQREPNLLLLLYLIYYWHAAPTGTHNQSVRNKRKARLDEARGNGKGTRFTCFTGTTVQILTLRAA